MIPALLAARNVFAEAQRTNNGKILPVRVDFDSVQLMMSYRFNHPLGYSRPVFVILKFVQIIRGQRPGAAYDISECITFHRVNPAVDVLPKSFYGTHDSSPCKKLVKP